MTDNDFSYVREDGINKLLRCRICTKPCIDPVRHTNDQTVSCRLCTTSTNVIPIEKGVFLEMLDQLFVTCNKCHQTNLRRIDYFQHKERQCPQRIVSCKAADLQCPWSGTFEQLDQHLLTCPIEMLRPTFTTILARFERTETITNKEREEWARAYEEMKNETQQLRAERVELQNAIAYISEQLDKLFIGPKPDVDSNEDIVQLRTLLNEQIERNKTLETEFQRLQRLFLKHTSLYNDLRTEFERHKQLINSNSDIEQLKEQFDQLHNQMKQLSIPSVSNENNNDQNNSLKQFIDRHDIQIKLLARRKCVIAVNTLNNDSELESYIDRFLTNSEIDLDGKQIPDHHIELISKKAIVDKRCSKLRLQKNKITGKGATTLANALYNNTTLIELYLSKNPISDSGVHALAQALSVNNSTLRVLDLYANHITDEGIDYLSEMLKINRTLVRLGLGSNQITDQGLRSLVHSLIHSNNSLQWLSLSKNPLITDKSLPIIDELFTSKCSLKTFWLHDCTISETIKKQLIDKAKSIENFNFEI